MTELWITTMPEFRPTYLWIETLKPGRYGNVMDAVEIAAPRSYERGGEPEAWYIWRVGVRDVLAVADVTHVHVHNRGWIWRTESPEKLPEPPFLLTDDPDIRPVFEGPVNTRPTGSIRELIEGEILEGSGRFVEALRESGWVGALIVDRVEADRGHLVAFSKSAIIPKGGELFLPDLEEMFGQVDLSDGETLGSLG